MKNLSFQIFPAGIGRKVVIFNNKHSLYVHMKSMCKSYHFEKTCQQLYRYEYDSDRVYNNYMNLKSITLYSMMLNSLYQFEIDCNKFQLDCGLIFFLHAIYCNHDFYFNSIEKNITNILLDLIRLCNNPTDKFVEFLHIIGVNDGNKKFYYKTVHLLLYEVIYYDQLKKIHPNIWAFLLEHLTIIDSSFVSKMLQIIKENYEKVNFKTLTLFLSSFANHIYKRQLLKHSTQNQKYILNNVARNQLKLLDKIIFGLSIPSMKKIVDIQLKNFILVNVDTFLKLKSSFHQELTTKEMDLILKILKPLETTTFNFIPYTKEYELKYLNYIKESLYQFMNKLKTYAEKHNTKLYTELLNVDHLLNNPKRKFLAIVDASNLIFHDRKITNNVQKYTNISPYTFSRIFTHFMNKNNLNNQYILVILNRNSPIISSGCNLKQEFSKFKKSYLVDCHLLKDDAAMLYSTAKSWLIQLESIYAGQPHEIVKLYSSDHFYQYNLLVSSTHAQYFDEWLHEVVHRFSNKEIKLDRHSFYFDQSHRMWLINVNNTKVLRIQV